MSQPTGGAGGGITATVTSALSSAYESWLVNPAMDLLLSHLPLLESMRSQLLAGIPTTHSSVVEVGPGTGLNFPHYPQHVTTIETLSPQGSVPESLMAKAAERGLFVRHHTYLTLRQALDKGLKVAKVLGLTSKDLPDPSVTPCMFPFATGSLPVITCTLVLCTIPQPHLPYYLAEIARVLVPNSGRYFFLEHIPDGDPSEKSAMWRALQTVHGVVACGCDIGRRSLDVMKAALSVDDCAVYHDERAVVRATFGLVAYGSAKVVKAVTASEAGEAGGSGASTPRTVMLAED
ncbi:hypothetical protein BCR44DRAFT_1426744 [Catenaria anguillulae PL171]|uniref:S-adenosyl-L-methionine-dependent methyltransferase n=1 Tax=Catenaria anguillulae PL171 TaxID=765915 RepID=A0A1Y2HY62_9FUNG|nr:hypothetical protein BCR44DRAFT_1426744 [Catenaria anguillulae PL171]